MKHLHIAVIGSPSSGKSYLLYDMIHAFHHLGYVADELPLSYPHSSFGSFFYDAINPMTGGLRGTERYACRPENHYGAFLSKKGLPFSQISVDFLNIPGEAFRDHNTMDHFFTLRNLMLQKGKRLFCLSEWETPSGHIKKLILPDGFRLKAERPLSNINHSFNYNYKAWNDISYELYEGAYEEKGTPRRVSGRYIMRHITELSTDSVLLSIKDQWAKLTATSDKKKDYNDFDGIGTFKYFYFFAYCQLATDMIICDRLNENHNSVQLTQDVCRFMNKSGKTNPKVYLAFRGIDQFIQHNSSVLVTGDIDTKNKVYTKIFSDIISQVLGDEKKGETISLPDDIKSHIIQSCGTRSGGNGFWYLLNTATPKLPSWSYYLQRIVYGRKTVSEVLRDSVFPPHVYFTATPIDKDFSIYRHDDDITRFISIGPSCLKSFVKETCKDMSHHFCFGALQLLIDILLQNNIGISSKIMRSNSKELKYAQSKLIK